MAPSHTIREEESSWDRTLYPELIELAMWLGECSMIVTILIDAAYFERHIVCIIFIFDLEQLNYWSKDVEEIYELER